MSNQRLGFEAFNNYTGSPVGGLPATSPAAAAANSSPQRAPTPSSSHYQNHRPAPIRIPAMDDPAHGGVGNNNSASSPGGSPRAALVAGLRSATDRRQRERLMMQEQNSFAHTIQGQMSPPNSPSPYQFPQKPYGRQPHHQHQHQSSSSSSSSSISSAPVQDRVDSRVYAALQHKQQELYATSMLISQQQMRIQQAMSNAAMGLDPTAALDSTTSLFAGMNISELSVPQAQLEYPTGGFHGFNRPSSPSLPVRPNSSASNRGSFYGGHFESRTPPPPHISMFANNQPQSPIQQQHYSSSSTQQQHSPSASSFRRGHRKASSLSSNVYSYGTIGPGQKSSGEQPSRQPIGPPPLDELIKNNSKNFASRLKAGN